MIPNLVGRSARFPRTGMRALAAALPALLACSAQAADTQRGASLYATHCLVCHGANGTPVMPGSPNFRRMEGLMRPDMQLVTAIRNGKGAMPGYFGILRDREILDVIAYLRTFG
jgi:cytochrome c6